MVEVFGVEGADAGFGGWSEGSGVAQGGVNVRELDFRTAEMDGEPAKIFGKVLEAEEVDDGGSTEKFGLGFEVAEVAGGAGDLESFPEGG